MIRKSINKKLFLSYFIEKMNKRYRMIEIKISYLFFILQNLISLFKNNWLLFYY